MSTQEAEAVQRVLAARARALAQPLPELTPQGNRLTFMTFTVGGERWALPTAAILAVAPLNGLTAVPGEPPAVAGVVNYRGEILSVIDIGPLFGLAAREARTAGMLIVVAGAGDTLALAVDAVLGLEQSPAESLAPVPAGMAIEQREYVTGILAPATAVLDLDRLLGDQRLSGDREASL